MPQAQFYLWEVLRSLQGTNFYANFGCVFLYVAKVGIGKNCFICPQVGVYIAIHQIDYQSGSSSITSILAKKIFSKIIGICLLQA